MKHAARHPGESGRRHGAGSAADLSLRVKLSMAGSIRLCRRTAGQRHAVNAGRAF